MYLINKSTQYTIIAEFALFCKELYKQTRIRIVYSVQNLFEWISLAISDSCVDEILRHLKQLVPSTGG